MAVFFIFIPNKGKQLEREKFRKKYKKVKLVISVMNFIFAPLILRLNLT